MSIRVMTRIWDCCLYEGGTLLVLLALADFAHDDGSSVHPSLKTLASKARMQIRNAQLCLKKLREDLVLMPVGAAKGGRGNVTEYRIDLQRMQSLQAFHEDEFLSDPHSDKGCKKCQERWEKGENLGTKGCSPRQERVQPETQRVQNPVPHIEEPLEPSGTINEPLGAQAPPQNGQVGLPGLPTESPPPPPPPVTAKLGRGKGDGTRWPPDARVPIDWHPEARAACEGDGLTVPDLRLEAGKFERYWASKSGKDATKVDWKKTFINWIIKAAEDATNRANKGKNQSTNHQRHRAGWAGLIDAEAGRSEGVPESGQLALGAPAGRRAH